jgi:hypothetical protein
MNSSYETVAASQTKQVLGTASYAAGSQVIDVGGEIAGGSATGLANDTTTYGFVVTIDGVANTVEVVGSAAQTYTDLLTEIDADLSGATSAIVGGNVKVTSSSTGTLSSISIADTAGASDEALLASLTDFVEVEAAVHGTGGQAGDYLDRLIITVGTAATAATSITDGGGTVVPIMPNSPGGGVGAYVVEVKAHSRLGSWSVTTGAGATVLAVGNFT